MIDVPWELVWFEMGKVREELKTYAVGAVAFIKNNNWVMLESGMGSGKTLMCLTGVLCKRPKKILILCSTNALYTWQKEVAKWYPSIASSKFHTVVVGTAAQRKKLWARDTLFYVCTYQSFMADMFTKVVTPVKNSKTKKTYSFQYKPIHEFDVVISDEVHRSGLRNRATQVFAMYKELAKFVSGMVMTTGTWISKGPHQMWPILNILDPKLFSSYWRFVHTYCIVEDGPFGRTITGAQNTSGLMTATKHVLYSIPKEVTDTYLPPIVRGYIDVEMNPTQRKAYDQLDNEMYLETDDGNLLITSSVMAKLTRLRQLCICPQVLGINDPGVGIEAIIDKLKEREDYHCIIYTPFTSVIPYLQQYLRQRLNVPTFSLSGGMGPAEVKRITEECKKTRGILFASILFAQSWEVETAEVGFFLGYDWDQQNNFQAEARARRLISKSDHIYMYYIRHRNSIEEYELEMLSDKVRNCRVTYQDINQLRKALHYGRDMD